MPKKTRQDKQSGSQRRSRSPRAFKSAKSVHELFNTRGALHNLALQREPQQQWLRWLAAALPEELGAHLVNVVAKSSQLVVYADSAVWSARLRYALAAIEPQLKARDSRVQRVEVRVAARQDASAV